MFKQKKSIAKASVLLSMLVALVMLFVTISPALAVSGILVPPSGNKLLLIGQDVDSIEAYAASLGIAPGGVTGYTSINEQEGLTSNGDNGAGRNNTLELAVNFPNSTIRESIWIVNQCQNIIDNTAWGAVKDYNVAMDQLIDTLLSFNRPVYMSWGYEFDGIWNKFDPTCYKGAWVRMWDRMTLKNAHDKIAMVWQSSAYCGGTYNNYPIDAWYPGDQYVDWIGLSYFTPQDCNWTKVDEVVQFARAHNKPVIITESSPQRYDIGDLTYTVNSDGTGKVSKTADQIWNEWFVPYFNFINNNSDVIKAADYINADWDSQRMWNCPPCRSGYWGDSRVQANAIIKANWINTITSNGWLNASPSLFDTLGYPGGVPTPGPSVTPTTTPGGSTVMHVQDLYTANHTTGLLQTVFHRGDYVDWRVQIVDQAGNPVSGGTVNSLITKPDGSTWNFTATTDANGWAVFTQHTTTKMVSGIYTIQIINVTKTGATYDASANAINTTTFTLQ